MNLGGIHHVTLIVDDEERAAWFYGEVLGLKQRGRPAFEFPGLFYDCGSQEIHLIVASRPLTRENLFIKVGGDRDLTRRHIHRHAAFLVPNLAEMKARLKQKGVKILFDPSTEPNPDELASNMVAGWTKMYGAVPIFCLDPFDNLIEFVPARTV